MGQTRSVTYTLLATRSHMQINKRSVHRVLCGFRFGWTDFFGDVVTHNNRIV